MAGRAASTPWEDLTHRTRAGWVRRAAGVNCDPISYRLWARKHPREAQEAEAIGSINYPLSVEYGTDIPAGYHRYRVIDQAPGREGAYMQNTKSPPEAPPHRKYYGHDDYIFRDSADALTHSPKPRRRPYYGGRAIDTDIKNWPITINYVMAVYDAADLSWSVWIEDKGPGEAV